MARRDSLSVRLWRSATRALSPVAALGLWCLYAKDLSLPLVEFRARVPVEIGEVQPDEVAAVARLIAANADAPDPPDLRRLADWIRDRIRGSARCFVARLDGAVVHVNWVIFDRIEYWPRDDAVTPLRPGEVYTTDGYTVNEARGQGIHTEVLNRMLLWLQQAGYHRAYTMVAWDNEASWKTHVRLDWELSGLALQVRPRWSKRIRVAVAVWGLAGREARMGGGGA